MSTTFDTEIVKQNKARLNAAFRDLRAQGILAKQNYTCCQTCGFNDLEVEAERLTQEGQKIKGGVFYHAQDTDYMRESGQCWLAYCGFDADQNASSAAQYDSSVRIGRIACETLRRHGVRVEWDGSLGKRIVADLTAEAGGLHGHSNVKSPE